MTQNAYTPGPWHVGMAPGPIIYGADSSQVADLHGDLLPRPETIANMRLIISAPALLAALESAVRHLVYSDSLGRAECAAKIERVIASARGEG